MDAIQLKLGQQNEKVFLSYVSVCLSTSASTIFIFNLGQNETQVLIK